MDRKLAERVMDGDEAAICEWYVQYQEQGRGNYTLLAAKANEVCRLVVEGRLRFWPDCHREWLSIAEAVSHVNRINWSCGHGPANWISSPDKDVELLDADSEAGECALMEGTFIVRLKRLDVLTLPADDYRVVVVNQGQ